MINRFSKGNRILFIDSHWYVPRENMLICSYSLLRRNSIVRVLYQNAGKNLPLIGPSPTTALRVLWVQTDIQETYQHQD